MGHRVHTTDSRPRSIAGSRLTLALAAVLAITGFWPPTSAGARPADRGRRGVPVVRLAFSPVAGPDILVDGPRVLLGGRTLIDERTGAQTQIAPPPGCVPIAIGGPWIAAECGIPRPAPYLPEPALYSITTGGWSAVPLAPSIAASCTIDEDCHIRRVGRDWLAIFGGLCNHCAGRTLFQRILTGEARPDPTAATTLPDLSSPTLAAPVCSPLRLPPSTIDDTGAVAATLGRLDFAGRFALATTDSASGPSTTYLEHCGSSLHTFVCHCDTNALGYFHALVANDHVVIWATRTRLGMSSPHLDGLYLPSRRRFQIPLPPALISHGPVYLQLSSRTLYLDNGGGGTSAPNVFSAPAPRRPAARG